jgi:sec-independent protein translocase protein TatC
VTDTAPVKRPKRNLGDYGRVFGRAHKKASLELETSLPLLQHLEELRQRVFRAFGALIVTTALSFIFAEQIINYLASPLGGSSALVSIEVTENISIFMRVSMLSGVILAMPVMVYQLLSFILPGLKQNEKRYLQLGVPGATFLFLSGVAFAWFILIPTAVPFLVEFMNIQTNVRPLNYFQFITALMFWIGLFFEMPLVVMVLARMGMITARQMISVWRYAVVAIAVVAAVITPTPDPVNMGLVMLPLSVLYVISTGLAYLVGKRTS